MALVLTPFGESERVPVYEYRETHFPRLRSLWRVPMDGIFGERSISYRNTGPRPPASASAAGREIQGGVWNFS